jgi:hypothetical protein
LPEILRREIATNGKSKEIDDFVDMRAGEMGAEDAPTALLGIAAAQRAGSAEREVIDDHN